MGRINTCRGLAQFRERHSPFYFGRKEIAANLADTMRKKRFVGVVGGTGAGKSSLVRAGLLPSLRDPAEGVVWFVIDMTPGEDPLETLAVRLIPNLHPETGLTESAYDQELIGLKRRLASCDPDDRGALARIARRVLEKNPGIDRILLFVDQFEEVYTLSSGGVQGRSAFLRNSRRFR